MILINKIFCDNIHLIFNYWAEKMVKLPEEDAHPQIHVYIQR